MVGVQWGDDMTNFLHRRLVLIMVTLLLGPGAWAQGNYRTLHRFNGGSNGGTPRSGLIFDASGNLYGTTFSGGDATCNCGVVFRLTASSDGSWKESALYAFSGGSDGASPVAGLIFDHNGNLYGTTLLGGAANFGTVFELTPNASGKWTETVLYSFTGGSDGGSPAASLIFDQKGNLYGTTETGGAPTGYGVVFKLALKKNGAWTESVLLNFDGKGGAYSQAGLIFDQAGNLYGTAGGGALGYGVVFKLAPKSNGHWTESVLHVFTDGTDGGSPAAGMIFDQAGNLYGTTAAGGGVNPCAGNGCGVVFRLTPDAKGKWTESVLHSFCSLDLCMDGADPQAGLTFDSAGKLYGTTFEGGSPAFHEGVVFRLAPNSKGGWNETVLHRFVDNPGTNPASGLISDAAGNLYGTTLGDGEMTAGSVFQVAP
jgi:uncharacterized repeat protein (TIGR03803 family)